MADLSAIAGFYTSEYCSQSYITDPVAIAESQHLGFSLNDYGNDFDGLLENINGKFHIYLNNKNGNHLHHPRLRFSFAHELGHYLINEHYRALSDLSIKPIPSFQTFDMVYKHEVEADYFASCLLMPEERILKDIEKQKFSFTVIDEIARKYNVSHTAALLRFIGIGNHPLMIVCTRASKIRWMRYSFDFPFEYVLGGIGSNVPEYTSAGEYFYEGIKNLNKTETVFAKDWFLLSRKEDRNRSFKEYCLYYEPMNQVISVLWE